MICTRRSFNKFALATLPVATTVLAHQGFVLGGAIGGAVNPYDADDNRLMKFTFG